VSIKNGLTRGKREVRTVLRNIITMNKNGGCKLNSKREGVVGCMFGEGTFVAEQGRNQGPTQRK